MRKKTKDQKPLFFLFTCVKDGNNYIEKLLDSLIKQTRKNFVHFIYEDGSGEPLGEMINKYKRRVLSLEEPYDVVYEYNKTNLGLTKATQYCISKCTCPYFIWIDCDNYVDIHFFEELERLYRKNKGALLLRSTLYNYGSDKLYYANRGSIEDAYNSYQLGLFIRRKYYYSFFAVNTKKYKLINPSNIMIDEKGFYNDEQVLTLCLLQSRKTPLSKKAKGYFLVRERQESSQLTLPLDSFRNLQIKLCNIINKEMGKKMSVIYEIKDKYDMLFQLYKNDFSKSLNIVKDIKRLSKEYNISLKNYYNYSLCKIFLKMYYWRIKNNG